MHCLQCDKAKPQSTPQNFLCELPMVIQPADAWRSAINEKCQEMLNIWSRNMPADAHQNMSWKACIMEGIKIVDKSYLEWKFWLPIWNNTIDDIVAEFTLNKDQEHAFHIVGNHICHPSPEQLKMYIGGMAGTRKSQVLKAMMRLFEVWNESHWFVVVAPTRNAASLLGGSTYHSLFGVNDWGNCPEQMSKIRARLVGIDYVFLDEVSMLSCCDVYCLSRQIIWITGDKQSAFGSLNIIFAGDLAQLSPPKVGRGDASLYSQNLVNCSERAICFSG